MKEPSASHVFLEMLLANTNLRARVQRGLDAKTVKADNDDQCWMFAGRKLKSGYGIVKLSTVTLADGRRAYGVLAHRAAYVLARNSMPTGGNVLHSCDTPACVNPRHLFAGTVADNMRDKHKKGRATLPPHRLGEAHARHKFTSAQAVAVISMTAAGKQHREICDAIGVSENFVAKVRNGRTWSHVTGVPKRT